MEAIERFLCLSSYENGHDFLRQCAQMGVRPTLLTLDKHRDAAWPREALEDLATMPPGLNRDQILNTVSWMARGRRFDRIVALDDFDLETAAQIREHMRIPGMGATTAGCYRDNLVMRIIPRAFGFLVPEFCRVLNYDELRDYMARVPAPWLLKPRTPSSHLAENLASVKGTGFSPYMNTAISSRALAPEGCFSATLETWPFSAASSALGARIIEDPEQLWRTLDDLGDLQSRYLLEQFVPGDIFHVDSIVSECEVKFSVVHECTRPRMSSPSEAAVFTTRTVDRASRDWRELTALNAAVAPSLGMVRGVTHAEFVRAHADGRFYFLAIAARVGGAFVADLVEAATGVNLWREWARLEVADLRHRSYAAPKAAASYAGSVLSLSPAVEPDTSTFNHPEIVSRIKSDHHVGLIVRAQRPERVTELLAEYSEEFVRQSQASPPPDSLNPA